MLKKLLTHSAVYGIAPQIPRLAGIFILPFTTPFLSKTDFGVFTIVTIYTTMLASLKELGLPTVMSLSFFKHPNHYKKTWSQLYGFLNLWAIFYASVILTVLYFAIPSFTGENKWLILALTALPMIFFGSTMSIASLYYQLQKQPFQIAIRAIIVGLIAVLINYYTIAVLHLGYMGFFWSGFASSILYNASYIFPLYGTIGIRPNYKFKWRYISNALKVGAPLIPHQLGAYLQNSSDRLVMDRLRVPPADLGAYGFMGTIADIFASMGMAVNKAIAPFLMQDYKDEKYLNARALIFIWLIGSFLFFSLGGLWLREVFSILINNPELEVLYPLTIILIMSHLYRPLYVGSTHLLTYIEKTGILFRVTLITGAINIVLNLILIPIYGYTTAVFTTYLTYMLQGLIFFYFRTYKEHSTVRYYPMMWVAIQLFLTILVYTSRDLDYPYKILISLFLGAIAFLAFKKVYSKIE